jgi:hypothetical protein
MYSDDIDLSYRVLQTGRRNYYFPETTVIHYKGESTVKDGTYMKRFQEAMNFFYKKHFSASVFFSLFMKMGIVFFSVVKMVQGKTIPKRKPEGYLLVSNEEFVKVKLQPKLQKIIERTTVENGKIVFSQSISEHKQIEAILDLKYMSFKEAIVFMEQNTNNSFTFKMLPMTGDFILGSNSSNERGEVINL